MPLRLDGGDLTLFRPTVFASLYGKGTVCGDTLSVTGDVVPSAEKHEDAIVFEYAPLLANGVPDGWSMRNCAEGASAHEFLSDVVSVGFSTPVGRYPDCEPQPPPVAVSDPVNFMHYIEQRFHPDNLFPDGFRYRMHLAGTARYASSRIG